MGRPKSSRKPPGQKKPPLTHFLCLPLVTSSSRPQLEASLRAFKDDVTPQDPRTKTEADNAGDDGQESTVPAIHPKAIRSVGSLHCTLGVMSLDKDKLSGAIEHLQGIDVNGLLEQVPIKSVVVKDSTSATDAAGSPTSEKPITPPNFERSAGPITVDLKGLVSMHPPHKTSILYSAPTDDTGRLYPFCHALQKSFKEEGFLLDDNRELKLHATIVNTIYAKGRKRPPKRSIPNPTEQSSSAAETQPSQGHGPNADAPLKIDASAILEKYKDYIWADNVVLDRVAICEMGAKKITDDDGNVLDEVYTEVASIALPK